MVRGLLVIKSQYSLLLTTGVGVGGHISVKHVFVFVTEGILFFIFQKRLDLTFYVNPA